MRRWSQALFTLLQNAYLAFPWTGTIYQGRLKTLCTPGLNCYSCPAAVVSCPLGTLQHFFAAARPALRWGTYRFGFSVVGFLLSVGLLAGRFPCGWLCPFGLFQDLLHKIPSPKLRLPARLVWLRWAMLLVAVVALPLLLVNPMGYGEAWFCRLVCPAGTLEAGSLFLLIPDLREQIGPVFVVKLGILAAVVGFAVLAYRPYCRSLCPLGAIYGLLNRWSLLAVECDPTLCGDCGSCVEGCEVELDPRRGSRDAACLRCFACARHNCPRGALSIRFGNLRFQPQPCAPPSTPDS